MQAVCYPEGVKVLAAVLAAWLAPAAAAAAAAAPAPAAAPEPEPVTFQTDDGWRLVGEYRPPQDGMPVAVLIHGLGGTRAQWASFSRRLAALGLGTLAFDLRGYGDSTQGPYGPQTFESFTDMDWPKTVDDVNAALDFLRSRGIPPSRVGLAGSIVGADIAAMAAAMHPDLAWLVLLSPGNDYHGLGVGEGGSIEETLVAAAQDDTDSMTVCQNLVDLDASRTFIIAPGGRGIGMLKDHAFRKRVLDWIEQASR